MIWVYNDIPMMQFVYPGEADEMLSVALGNTCHLVTMMAKFMELPLRYPMRPMGSRSAILDLVKDKLVDREREYVSHLQ